MGGCRTLLPSSFSKYRHGKFRDSDLLGVTFEGVAERCIKGGLVGDTGFAVDASLTMADMNELNSRAQAQLDAAINPKGAARALKDYLKTRDGEHKNATGAREWANAFGVATPLEATSLPRRPDQPVDGRPERPAVSTYSDNAVILDAEPSRSVSQAKFCASRSMIERVEARFGLKSSTRAAIAYGKA